MPGMACALQCSSLAFGGAYRFPGLGGGDGCVHAAVGADRISGAGAGGRKWDCFVDAVSARADASVGGGAFTGFSTVLCHVLEFHEAGSLHFTRAATVWRAVGMDAGAV